MEIFIINSIPLTMALSLGLESLVRLGSLPPLVLLVVVPGLLVGPLPPLVLVVLVVSLALPTGALLLLLEARETPHCRRYQRVTPDSWIT